MPNNWDWTDGDAAAAAELIAQLPESIFDAHAHLYRTEDLTEAVSGITVGGPDVLDIPAWHQMVGRQVGESKLTGGLFFPLPTTREATTTQNAFLLKQLANAPQSRGLVIIHPGMTQAEGEALATRPGVVGFKVYHYLGDHEPSFDAPLSAYLPAWAWQVADTMGLVIVIHMVRTAGLSDADNQRAIIEGCTRYPHAKVVLAHAARGFHAPSTVGGVAALRGLQNVWFDSSAICEPEALVAILNEFGPSRLMWGSDLPICERRGKCVTVGDSFAWICPSNIDVNPDSPAMDAWPVGLESLRALLKACDQACLDDEERADVFGRTAQRMVGILKEETGTTQALYDRACELMPGGVQLLSKRPEMFAPGTWPAYYRDARGCETWDLDGKHYLDFTISGIGACLLGMRDPDVTRAVKRTIDRGSMASLNPREEVELAERLCTIHPWAESTRFARTGGEMAAVAVRIARSTTDRSKVAICGYHGWADWYLAANLGNDEALRGHLLPGLDPLGVPQDLRGTTLPFTYNDRARLQAIIDQHGDDLAAVVMEPCRGANPEPGFLEFVREITQKAGVILIFDEITIGWRRTFGGAHLLYDVTPDMALFAKTLGNGHPIAAVIGTASAMEGAHASFISSSYWTERVGPAAALATLDKMERVDVVGHVDRIGTLIQEAQRKAAEAAGVAITQSGFSCAPVFVFDGEQSQEMKTLFIQEMLAEGFLAGTLVYVTFAHNEEAVAKYAAALDRVFDRMAKIATKGDVAAALKGPVAHSGFKRLL